MGQTLDRKVNIVSHVVAVGLLCLMIFASQRAAEAFQFTVGGQSGWTVPSDSSSNPFNQWAERMRFLVGDSLVFVYQANQDSLLYVSKEAYDSCNTEPYISKFVDGHTVFKLNQSGPFHFISGVKDKCLKNEKMVVVVLADRSNKTSSPATPPPPPPSEEGSPSPPPSGEESPSPPASGSVEINPSPAPTSETSHPPPPHSSVPRSALIGFTGVVATAFAATSALMAL